MSLVENQQEQSEAVLLELIKEARLEGFKMALQNVNNYLDAIPKSEVLWRSKVREIITLLEYGQELLETGVQPVSLEENTLLASDQTNYTFEV
jgi:hypothetical protein